VGRILGPVPLGVFSMSQRFSRLPQLGLAGPMSSVVYVRMAKNLHDPAGIARIYLAAMHVLAAAMLTPLAMIAVAGDSIFSLFLGDEWRPVAPIFALSIPGLALEAVAMVCLSCLFRAMGRTDLQVRFALESGALRIAMVSVAVFGGLKLMAFSLTLWGLAMVPRGWHLAARIIPLARADCLRVLLWPVGIAAAMAVAQPVIVALADLGRWGDAGLAIIISLIGVSLTFLGDRRALKASVAVFR
jgi:O-antigen/teichoic acid export membrane protein